MGGGDLVDDDHVEPIGNEDHHGTNSNPYRQGCRKLRHPPPKNGPQGRQRRANDEEETRHCGEWVGGDGCDEIPVKEGRRSPRRAAGRAGDPGERAEDARPEQRGDQQPQRPQRESRGRRRQPQIRQLALFPCSCASRHREAATPARTPINTIAATNAQHRTTGNSTANTALPWVVRWAVARPKT